MILPLEDQVPSRQTCERLKEVGFPFATLFWSSPSPHGHIIARSDDYPPGDLHCPAPTAAELGALLRKAWLEDKDDDWVEEVPLGMEHGWMAGTTAEAEVRARLWLELHERDLLPASAYASDNWQPGDMQTKR